MSIKKWVLITGATSGIGKELARCFAANGYGIIIVARNEQTLKQTSDELKKKHGADVIIIEADLSEPDAAKAVFKKLNGKVVDVLVNNAGYAPYGPFVENEIETVSGALRLNIEALTELTHYILPGMIDRRSGKILNVASTAAFEPGPLMAVYYATKAYVLSFSEAIRYELRGTGISVTTLCPGATATNFQKKVGFGKSNLIKLGMMKASDVAQYGYHALMDDQAVAVPGFKNKLGRTLVRFAPRSIVLRVMGKLNRTEK